MPLWDLGEFEPWLLCDLQRGVWAPQGGLGTPRRLRSGRRVASLHSRVLGCGPKMGEFPPPTRALRPHDLALSPALRLLLPG